MNKGPNSIEEIISVLKENLLPVQESIEQSIEQSRFPHAFIVGVPRSGTTLLLQYLAGLGCFSYPSNVLARFSYAPYLGALIQQMLFEKQFDPLGELKVSEEKTTYNSSLGKSQGHLAPNEFQHFFRNYINHYFPQHIARSDFNKIDFESMRLRLNAIATAFNKPFVTKAMMMQFNLVDFYAQFPNCIFLYIKRDPYFTMQSIYLARMKYFNDLSQWWSVKPKEFDQLKDMSVYDQIAGQVYWTTKSIETEIEQIPNKNKLIFDYEDFCQSSKKYFDLLRAKYEEHGIELNPTSNPSQSFHPSSSVTIDKGEFEKLSAAYNKLKALT